ncbi:MAG: DUF2752 domain-containing protein [Prevotellaceae bacterium]|jgi:hypothetical protein|nr:DUF2752 domain-containing protein [Prevotellaceae bacterium]
MSPARLSNYKKASLIIICLILLGGVYFIFNPEKGFFPPCLFYRVTGFQCPGCGSQRAIHSLLHLRIGEAFCYNLLLIPALLLVFLLVYLTCFGGKKRAPQLYRKLSGRKFILSVLFIIIIYWIARNIF